MIQKQSIGDDSQRIAISIGEYRGHKFLLIQREYKKWGAEDWQPGKAVTVPLKLLKEFKGILNQVIDEYIIESRQVDEPPPAA